MMVDSTTEETVDIDRKIAEILGYAVKPAWHNYQDSDFDSCELALKHKANGAALFRPDGTVVEHTFENYDYLYSERKHADVVESVWAFAFENEIFPNLMPVWSVDANVASELPLPKGHYWMIYSPVNKADWWDAEVVDAIGGSNVVARGKGSALALALCNAWLALKGAAK